MHVNARPSCALFALAFAAPCFAANDACTGAALPADQRNDVDTIRRVERAWLTAEMRGDVGTVRCILADDYTNIGMDGGRHDRAEILSHAAARKGKNLPISAIEVTVVLQGNSAIAYSIQHKHDGGGKPLDVYFADAFAFDGSRWRAYFSNDMTLANSKLKITD